MCHGFGPQAAATNLQELLGAIGHIRVSGTACSASVQDFPFFHPSPGPMQSIFLIIFIDGNFKLMSVMEAPVAFGEIALMYKTKRTATITAKSHCTIWSLTRAEFNAIMKSINQNNYIDR